MHPEFLERRILAAGALVATLFATTAGLAQEDASEEVAEEELEEEILETVVVTGSRIERTTFDTTQPTTSFDAEFINVSGFNNTADAINAMPIVVASGTSLAESSGRNVGQSFADIYGLGTQRTLTLVNGRRSVSGNAPTAFGAAAGSQVDLNTLPTSLIERVDIVSIGGAPVYGSDAISGTINVIMKKDFEGFEIDVASGLATDDNDAWEHRIGLTAGFNFGDGRGNFAIGYEYNKTDAVLGNDRDFVNNYYYDFETIGFDPDDPSTGTRFFYGQGRSIPIVTKTGVPSPGNAIFGGTPLFALGLNYFTDSQGNPLQFGADGRLTPISIGVPSNNILNFVGGDGLLLQDYDSIRAPIERHIVNAFGHWDVTDNMTAFIEINAYSGKSSDPNAQPFYQSGLFGGDSVALPIPLDNPFLHPDDRQTLIDGGAGDTIYIHKAMDDLAQSGATAGTTDLLRFVVGLEGAFEVAGRSVSWDISYNRGESESETQNTQLVQANYEEALDVEVDGSGNIVCSSGNSACVPLNIFGIVTDPAAIDYVTVQGFENAKIVQKVFEANISAEIFDLPGGPMQLALGYQTREEDADYRPDYFLENGLGRTAALAPLSGGFDTDEWYVEALMPLVNSEWIPFLSNVDLEGAYREIDHSSAGRDDAWNVGLQVGFDFPVMGNITIRANQTESVRAPAVVELFLPRSETFSFASDPCDFRFVDSGPNPSVRRSTCVAQAQALGVDYDPATFQSVIVNASQQGFTGGNDNLFNERAESSSIGIVWAPEFAEDLRLSIDYVDIELTNAIESLSLTTIMQGCYDSGDYTSNACGQFGRSGTFQVDGFQTGFLNAGYRIFKGYQTNLDWTFDIGAVPGFFALRGSAFILDESLLSVTGAETDQADGKGLIGNSDIRANFGLSYLLNNWRFNWQVQYISSAVKSNTAPERTYDIPKIDDYWNHTAFVAYDFSNMGFVSSFADSVELSFAVRNIFDEDPPYGQNSFAAIGVYDLIGRYVTANLRIQF